VSHGQPKRHGPHQSIRSISIRMINAHECTLVSAHDAQKENGVWTVDRLQYAVPCTAFANTVLYRASVREHLSWDVGGREAGHARRERLTLHRRARRVEGTCATSEQRAQSALSAQRRQPDVRRRGDDVGCGDGQQPVAVCVPFPAAATTRMEMMASLKVRRQKSTSFGSLQQHNAAAVATPPRRGKGCLAHMVAHTARGNSECRSSNMQAHCRSRSSSSIVTITRLLSAR
jgi:hypothetical protein